MPFDHPLYVLFSSGTTGLPKAMVHRAGGVLLAREEADDGVVEGMPVVTGGGLVGRITQATGSTARVRLGPADATTINQRAFRVIRRWPIISLDRR